MNESTLKILSQAARNAAREVGLEEDFDQHSAIAGYTNPNATIQVKKKSGSSTAVGGKPNLPGLPAPKEEESTQPVSAASALAGMQSGTDAKSVLAELLASGDTLAYGAAKAEFDAMEAAKKEKQRQAAQNPYGGAQALQNALSIKAEALNRRAESIADFQAKLEKRIADFNAGRGTDTLEQLNREIAALTLRKDVYNRDLAAYEKEYAQMSGIILEGVQAVDAQMQEDFAERQMDAYYDETAMQDAYEGQKSVLYAEWQALNQQELETGIYGERTASDVWSDIKNLERNYQRQKVEADEYWTAKQLKELSEDDLNNIDTILQSEFGETSFSRFQPGKVKNEKVSRAYKELYEKYSYQDVEAYMQIRRRQKNAENSAIMQETIKKMTIEKPVAANVAVALTKIPATIGAAAEFVGQIVNNPAGYQTLDVNGAGNVLQSAGRTVMNTTTEQIKANLGKFWGNVASGAYQLGMSTVDSLVAMGTGTGLFLAASAATNTMQDIAERGGTIGQAMVGGVLAGAAESVFEEFSIEKWDKLTKKEVVRTVRDWIGNTAKSIVTNASEEMATEFANIVTDSIVMGGFSNYEYAVREMMRDNPNMSEGEAQMRVAEQMALEILKSGAGGAIMGGFFGLLGSGIAQRRTKLRDRIVGGAIAQGLGYKDSESFKIAARLQVKLNEGIEVTDKELYSLIEANQIQAEQREAAGENVKQTAAAESAEKAMGLPEAMEQIAAAIPQQVETGASELEAQIETERARNTVQDTEGEDMNVRTTEEVQETKTQAVPAREEVRLETVAPAVQESVRTESDAGNISALHTVENAAQVNTEENTTLSEAESIVAELAETHTGPGLASIVGETVRRLNARGSTTLAQEVNRAYNSFIKNGGSFNGRRETSRLSVSEGSEWSADQSAVGEGVGVPGGTESRAYGRRTGEGEETGTQNLREVLRGNEVRKVSSAELMGNSDAFRYATDDTVSVIDEQSEEGKKYASVYKTIRQSGSEPVLISGRVQYTGKDGRVHYSEGLSTADGRIIVSVDGEAAPEKIARHEVFHQTMRKIDKARRDIATQRMVRELKRKYSDAEIMEMLEEYTLRYAPIYGNNDSMIYQEFLADAYAGLNRFDRDITKYQREVVGMTAQERSAQEAEAKRNRDKQKTTRSDTSAEDAEPTLANRSQEDVNREISKAMDDALNVMTRIEGEDGTMMSVTSMREDMESGELGRILDKCVSIGAISSNDRTELVKMVDRVIGTIMKNSDILDFGQNITKNERAFLPVKPNSDALYGVSVEFSTVCRKRVLQQILQERLEEKYQTVITKEERIAIRDALLTLRKEGKKIEVACALCYVEAARLNAPGQIQKWLDDRAGGMAYYFALKNKSFNNGYVKQARVKAVDEAIRDGLAKGEKWENLSGSMPKSKLPQKLQNIGNEAAQSARYDYEPTAEEQKVIDAVREMPNEMFTTQDGLWELKNNYPQVFDAFSSSVRAATHSKMVEGDTPWYMGDSKKISDSLIRRRNKENGVRSQSWSDFQTIHILDYMAMVIEMASRNAKMHAYTKVADYIMLMGETGTMINGSLIPKSFNGKDLEWDPIEGIDYNVLSLLRDRYPDTVGNCAIGIDDKQIRMMLESNLIDYIIPYHRSGLSADARMRMHIEDWGEYQDKQTEKKADDSKKAGKKPIFSEWFHVEQAKAAAEKYNAENPEKYKKDVMYGAKRAMDDQAQNYIRLCESRNLSPKFEDFAGESGYWKLLIDRKMINQKTGEIIEQKAVTPKFNEDNIMEILSRTVADYAESNPDEQEAIEMVSRMWSEGKIQEMAADPRRVKAVMDVEVQGLAIAAKAATSEEYDTYMSESDAPRGTDYDDRGERWTGELREAGGRNAQQDITVESAEATEARDEIRRIIEDGDIPPETVSEAKAVAVGDKNFSEADIPAAVDLFDFEQLVSQFMTARDLGFDQIMRDYGIELDDTPQKPKKPRVSKFRSNTLAEIYGEDADRYFQTDDFSYLPISEQESMREAQRRLSTDAAGVIEKLRQYDSWGSADMDAAYAVLGILRHAAGVTGQKADIDALNEWARLMRSQNTKAGQIIQSNAKYSRNPLTLVLKASEFMDMMTERERSAINTIDHFETVVESMGQAETEEVNAEQAASEAKKRTKEIAGQFRQVTVDAHAAEDDYSGALAQAQELLDEAKGELSETSAIRRTIRSEISHLLDQRDAALRKLDKCVEDINDLLPTLASAEEQRDDAIRERYLAQKDLSDVRAGIRSAVSARKNAEAALARINEELNEQVEVLTQALREELDAKLERDSARADLRDVRNELNRSTNARDAALRAAERARAREAELAEQLEQVFAQQLDAMRELEEARARREAKAQEVREATRLLNRIIRMTNVVNTAGRLETKKLDRVKAKIKAAHDHFNEQMSKLDTLTQQAIWNTNDMVNAIEAVVDGDRDALIDVILRTAAIRKNKISRRMVRNLREEAKTGMDFDALKTLAMKQIENIAMDYQKRSFGEKVSVYQTLAQLLNLRTGRRNFTSNQIFDIVATTANNIGVIPDLLLSMVTGTRTVGVDFSWGSSAKRRGAAQGWRRAAIEVALDVDSGASKYGTAKRRTWNMQTSDTLGKGMSQLEKVMGYELNVTDEFLKESVRQETLRGLMKFVDRGMISLEEAQEMAEQDALYRSFQDDTLPGRILSGIKNALNNVGFSKQSKNGLIYTWGLGDLVQKYTQVPGALISRAVEFSPLGYLKAVHSLLTIRQDGKVSPEKQRAASLAIGRATTGTGIIAIFVALAVKGILKRRDDEENKDIAALSDSEGIHGSQINLSALARLIRGEDTKWRKGDVLIDVDFMEPINALMSIGTSVAKGELNLGEMIGESINALYQSIMETPTLETLQSFQDAIEYYDEEKDGPRAVSLLMTLMESSVTGFVPSIIRQVAQATDYAYRDQYTSQNQFTQLWDRIKNTLPGARQTLPEKLDNFGDVKDYEEPLINVLNSLVMPGGIYVYERGEVSEELARVREATGAENIYPSRYAPYSMKIGDETVDLTPEQREAYQKTRGTMTSTLMVELMASDVYQNLTDAERAEMLAKIVGIGNDTAKRELYEDLGKTYKTKTYDKYYDLVSSGMSSSDALDIMYRDGLIEPDYVDGEKVPGSEMLKSLDLIDSYGFEEDAYVEAAYQFLSDTRGEDFQIMLDAGLTTDDVSMVFREYMRLNNEDMSGAERATEFAYYVDSLGLDSNARATVLDTLKYSSGFSVTAETYEKYQAAGLSSESAKKVYDILGGLTSEDGKETSAAQKYRAFVDSDLTESEKIAAIGVVMGTDMLTDGGNPSSYAKFKTMLDDGVSLDDYVSIYEAGMVDSYPKLRTAKENGVSYDTYISFFGNFAAIDADGNGSLKQSEVVNALNDRPDLTNEEKAVLWQLAAIKWSAKNNPYNTRISAKVQDAVTSYKW